MLRRDECGQLSLLMIGYAFVLVVLILVGVDVSAAFLARRTLASAADAAALSAAQQVDRAAVYAGDAAACSSTLPIDPDQAAAAVDTSVADDLDDLHHAFVHIDAPATSVAGGVVSVRLSGQASVPFGRVIAVLLPGHGATVPITVSAHAESALSGAAGC